MADQRSRGGKKEGTGGEQSQKHQGVHDREDKEGMEGVAERPAEGQPGGPKQKSKSGRDK